jgi:hypothetical protein
MPGPDQKQSLGASQLKERGFDERFSFTPASPASDPISLERIWVN